MGELISIVIALIVFVGWIYLIIRFTRDLIYTIRKNLAKKQGDFTRVAQLYRDHVKWRKGVQRDISLGVAALYEHDVEQALKYLTGAYQEAHGFIDIISAATNLALAFLQKGWYEKALELMRHHRKKGSLTYIIALLMEGQAKEAGEVFSRYKFKDKAYAGCLLDFDPQHPATLEPVKRLAGEKRLRLYQPAMAAFVERGERQIISFNIEQATNKGDFTEVARLHRVMADRLTGVMKKNRLGLSALFEQKADQAGQLFIEAYNEAKTDQEKETPANNLATAYLQQGWNSEALKLLQAIREQNGTVEAGPYLMALLVNGELQEARRVCHDYHGKYKEAMETLIAFDPFRPETLEQIKQLLRNNQLWLFRHSVKFLIERGELEIFYLQPDRYQILQQEGQDLLTKLSEDPHFFQSKELRYLRSLITVVLPRVGAYEGCAGLYGLIQNLDGYVKTLNINPELCAEYTRFWGRMVCLFVRTRTMESFDPEAQYQLLKAQLPEDARQYVTSTQTCSLYISEALQVGIRAFQINEEGVFYVGFIPPELAESIRKDLEPICRVVESDESLADKLQPFTYRLVSDRDSISSTMLADMLSRLPSQYHQYFHEMRERLKKRASQPE